MEHTNRIPLSGAPNARDLGGYKTTDGRCVKPRRLIRSGELSRTTEEDRRILSEEYGLQAIVDFRTHVEREEKPEIFLPGVRCIHLPVMDETAMGITREESSDRNLFTDLFKELAVRKQTPEQYMASIYSIICTTEFSRRQYRQFFDILLAQEQGSVLWHCSAGKDRAGLAAALTLLSLGVPQDVIIEDYLLTGVYLKPEIDAAAAALAPKLPGTDTADLADCLLGVRKSYIETLFATIQKEGGDIPTFLERAFGLDEEKRLRLQSLYTE